MVPSRRNFALPIGIALVIIAVALSGRLLEATIFPSGAIVGTNRRAAALMAVQAVLAAVGVYLIARRPRVTAVHLTAFVLLGSMTAVAAAVLLQLAYVPPRVVSGWKAFAAPAEQHQLGFRGQRIDYAQDDYVVVLLGDSQVEAMALTLTAMPERVLETHLAATGRRSRVFSLGAGAYGTDQELLALEAYFAKYRADVVVLWQTSTNDIWNNVFNTHMASRNPKPTFWLDGGGRLHGPSETPGAPLTASRIVAFSLFKHTVGLPFRERSWERRLPEPYEPLARYDGPVRMEWQQRWDANRGGMRDEELHTEKSHMAVLFTPRSPRMQYGLDLTRALMHRIKAAVERQGGMLVVLQSLPPRDSAEPEDAVYVLHGKYFHASTAQERNNWQYVNTGFPTELIPVTVRDWRVSRDDAHLNEEATAQVMTDLAGRLRSHVERPRRPAHR